MNVIQIDSNCNPSTLTIPQLLADGLSDMAEQLKNNVVSAAGD
jgi:hypothetical protein